MELSSILQLGNFALGLFGSFIGGWNTNKRRATYYDEEAAFNRSIGAFNAEIAERIGADGVRGVARQPKRGIGSRSNEVAGRGISMEGSPMFVMGDPGTMGSLAAQEAYFNAQVNRINSYHSSYKAASVDMRRAEDSRMSAISSNIDIFKQFREGVRDIKSAFGAAKTESTQPSGSRLYNLVFGNS